MTAQPPTGADLERFAEVMRALGDATRLRILRALGVGELCVCDLAARVGVSQPLVSHHLKTLKASGLVRCRKEGPWVYYGVCTEAFVALGLGGLWSAGGILRERLAGAVRLADEATGHPS